MCLITLALDAHPQYKLVLAANRDEYHNRPTAPAAFWADAPDVFGGRDLVQGGGWLALSQRGRLAAVTNVRRMVLPDPAAPSRGQLVADFVRGEITAHAFAENLRTQAARYAGFNLLLWDGHEVLYLSNQPQFIAQALSPGVHAVSNAALDTPWPKLTRLKRGLGDWMQGAQSSTAHLLNLLADDHEATDSELPDTGVGLEMERFLSPPFIRGLHYGTRASTVIALRTDGAAEFIERRWAANGMANGEIHQRLHLSKSPPPSRGKAGWG